MKPTNEQTVQFELRVHYRQIERPDHRPASETFAFDSFEKMIARYYKERRRRALADRATGGEYRMHLTHHGVSECRADTSCRERHSDAINGTWFSMDSSNGARK